MRLLCFNTPGAYFLSTIIRRHTFVELDLHNYIDDGESLDFGVNCSFKTGQPFYKSMRLLLGLYCCSLLFLLPFLFSSLPPSTPVLFFSVLALLLLLTIFAYSFEYTDQISKHLFRAYLLCIYPISLLFSLLVV